MKERPTPETDAARYTSRGGSEVVAVDFARKLECQRDELMEALHEIEHITRTYSETSLSFGVVQLKAATAIAKVKGSQ